MPKIKAAPPKKVHKSQSDGIILLCKDDLLENCEESIQAIKLRHPHSNKAAMSWFINESVRSDGSMHLSTPINPVFLALPYLLNATTLSPLDQTLVDREFPETRRLLKRLDAKLLSQVADRKGDEDMNVWKYNETKTLAWLTKKIERVVKVLQEKNVQVTGEGVAMSNTFVKTKADSDLTQNKDTYLRYAHGIVSEYLPPSLSSSLLSSLALPELKPADPSSKRKLQVSQTLNMEDSEAKRIKLDTETLLSAEFKTEKATPNKPVQLSAKDKALARSASGTKPISSFFTRKPK
ncbi:hypothetical protein M8J76_006217 [Diaphorina citri]|nr:hypothetical protein M8J76_006217 [Diaphorina citri]